MANSKLSNAKNAKNDEFYTQYSDIEKEISAYLEFDPNVFKGKPFYYPVMIQSGVISPNILHIISTNFGLKNLISTS